MPFLRGRGVADAVGVAGPVDRGRDDPPPPPALLADPSESVAADEPLSDAPPPGDDADELSWSWRELPQPPPSSPCRPRLP
nr:hypothetical protein [Streptomyces incarnatus]